MSLQNLAREFVELCNQGKNFDAMHAMYDPAIVSVEGDGSETSGKGPVIKKSEVWQASNTVQGEKVRSPFFNGPNQFAVYYTFEVTPKSSGKRITLEEVGVYTVKDDKITREQFFYDAALSGGARA
ncbi:MAG TPA: nuclear transport factor 2 family protein [Burkholderiales bacterium]|nr:nuclear transport factor 2 family protein [Burkholderiales bacterium]